jgi:hypothetical protein
LDTFSPEEEKKIMRKVDRRILLLIGFVMPVKQVIAHVLLIESLKLSFGSD